MTTTLLRRIFRGRPHALAGTIRAVWLALAGLTWAAPAWSQSVYSPAYTFTTIAGTAPDGVLSADGTGRAARFNAPRGIAVDAAGNVYVGDSDNHTIRKITPAGAVTTLAGLGGTPGQADGSGSAARFSEPEGVAVDAGGNVYVADSGNATVRKISSAGVVTTLAGSPGDSDSVDGTGGAARFLFIRGVAVDATGNIYAADSCTVRKITPAGVVTTLAGQAGSFGYVDATGAAARFTSLGGITVDGGGNVYVSDSNNAAIRKITPAGVVTTLVQLLNFPTSGSSAFPEGLAADSDGNIYAADYGSLIVFKVTPGGSTSILAGADHELGSVDATGAAARFNNPFALALDGAGNAYVTDTGNNTVRKITPVGVVTTLAGLARNSASDGPAGSASFYQPGSVVVAATGTVYVADTYNHTIRAISPAGLVTTLAGLAQNPGSADGTGSAARFSFPLGLALAPSGNLYVGERGNHTIRMVTPAGVVTTIAGSPDFSGAADGTGAAARFDQPSGLALDAGGNIFVSDRANQTVRQITPAGVVTTVAGVPYNSPPLNGHATFGEPYGVAVDEAGNLYVTDLGGVKKIDPVGNVTTLAGGAAQPNADGVGAAAGFYYTTGIAIDPNGILYVVDEETCLVRRITSAGSVTTLGGSLDLNQSSDGAGSAARFAFPMGVAVDADGAVYVADSANNTIRKGVPTAAIPLITTQPAGQVMDAGGPVTFTAAASGTPAPAFQWQKDGVDIPGATSASLTIAVVQSTDAGSYRIAATNFAGVALSDAAILTVNQLPQTITFAGPADGEFSFVPVTLGASASSGLAVSFSILTGPASVAGDVLTLTGVGSVTVRAAQAGNGIYAPAPAVDRTFTIAANFASWQQENFTADELTDANLSGPTAFRGADGYPNLVKYALGLDPHLNITTGLPGVSTTATDWVYTYVRPGNRPDLAYAVEISTDLATWSTAGVTHEMVSSVGGFETWHALYPLGSAGNVYFRLRVTR